MTRPLQIFCAFEDRAFEDVVLPLVERVCRELGLPEPEIRGPLFSRGCRWKALEAILRDGGRGPDLVLIGADTGPLTVAQKRAAMRGRVERAIDLDRVVYALPRPCAEGWIQADLQALKRGVEDALEEGVSLREDAGGYPQDENGAKERLASILDRSGVPILRGGLEYAPAVMRHARLSTEPSLEEFDRELRRWLSSTG